MPPRTARTWRKVLRPGAASKMASNVFGALAWIGSELLGEATAGSCGAGAAAGASACFGPRTGPDRRGF
jgi:hypothetical protein